MFTSGRVSCPFRVGRTIVDIALPVASDRESPAWFPGAHWSLVLSPAMSVARLGFLLWLLALFWR
jgi:hypothetical protein